MSQEHPKPGEWYARSLPPKSGAPQEWAVLVNHVNGTRSMIARACANPESADQAEIELASQRSEETAVAISGLPDLITAARDVTKLTTTKGCCTEVTDPVLVNEFRVALVKLQMALWKATGGPSEDE